jgi:hypothetical protein
MPWLEHDLFSFGKVVPRVAIECQLSKRRERNNVFWHDLGRIKKIKAETELVVFFHDLSLELEKAGQQSFLYKEA